MWLRLKPIDLRRLRGENAFMMSELSPLEEHKMHKMAQDNNNNGQGQVYNQVVDRVWSAPGLASRR